MGTHNVKEDAKKSRWSEPWLIRRIAYTAIALLLLVAVGFGVITPEQSDAWLSNADKALGILVSLGLLGAAVKANPGSDLSLSEIEQARADVAAAKLTPGMVDDLIAQAKLAAITVKNVRDTVAVVEADAAAESATASVANAEQDASAATAVAQAESASENAKPFSVYH